MVRQYLDVCEWEVDGGVVFDDNGFPTSSPIVEVKTAKCRYENFNAGNRKEFIGADGKTILQLGIVYIKKGEEIPKKFQRIKINRDSEIVFEGNALNIYKGQLNTTIAVS